MLCHWPGIKKDAIHSLFNMMTVKENETHSPSWMISLEESYSTCVERALFPTSQPYPD